VTPSSASSRRLYSIPSEPYEPIPPRGDDAVAGDEWSEPVAGAERAGGARSPGSAGERRKLAVGDDLAAWQRPQHPLAIAVEAVVQVRARHRRSRPTLLRRRPPTVPRGMSRVRPWTWLGGRGNSDQRTRAPSSHRSPIPKGGASYCTSVASSLNECTVAARCASICPRSATPTWALPSSPSRSRATTCVPPTPSFVVGGLRLPWFLGSLRARLIRYDPDGFFASIVPARRGVVPAAADGRARDERRRARGPRRTGVRASVRDRVVAGRDARSKGATVVRQPGRGRGPSAFRRRRGPKAATHWTLAGTALWASVLGFMSG